MRFLTLPKIAVDLVRPCPTPSKVEQCRRKSNEVDQKSTTDKQSRSKSNEVGQKSKKVEQKSNKVEQK